MAIHKILLPDGVTELANVKSVTFKETVNSGADLRPGCVGSASIEVEVYGAQTNAVSVGDALTYYQIDKNGTQTLIGVFYAEPVIATKNSWKFVAYDAAQKLNADFSSWLQANQASFPMTIYALVSAACTEAGVTLGSASWTLSTESVQAFYADGITCRQILSYAAELGCKFVRCHSDGKVYFDWYATVANKRIYPSAGTSGSETRYAYKQDGLSYSNFTTAGIDGVAVHPSGEDDVAYIYPTTPTGDNLLNITNNLLLTGADAALYNAAAQAIYTALNTLGTYRPFTARLFPMENPFRAGDVVAVTDAQGVSFTTVVMEQTVTDSDATLISTGNEKYADGESNIQKAVTQLNSDIVRINKLKVDWADIDTAIINYLTANDVVAQNLTIVDAADNVLATFNANGITLGQTGDFHAEIDYSSLQLIDKDGNVYALLGDARDASGESTVQKIIYENAALYIHTYTLPGAISVDSVTVNGNVIPSSDYSLSGDTITITGGYTGEIVIVYKSTNIAPFFTFGSRDTNKYIGSPSTVAGSNCAAESKDSFATGTNNDAHGGSSAVVGGISNTANGASSAILGGENNTANGVYSVVLGGRGLISKFANQLVFGTYNVEDPNASTFPTDKGNYAEIVGGGSSNNSRRNIRTLDWSGNEYLDGDLTTRGGISASGNLICSGLTTGAIIANGGATMSGELLNTSYFTRKLSSAPSFGTMYYATRIKDQTDTYRGGIGLYRSSSYGDGIRILHAKDVNGTTISNGVTLYIGDSGTSYVVVDQPSAWRTALGYQSGDTLSFGTDSYVRWTGDWRNTTNLWFTIPLNMSCIGLTATVSGSVIVISNNTRTVVSLSSVTTNCYVSHTGVTVNMAYSSAPSYAVASGLANVQAYGLTITFS